MFSPWSTRRDAGGGDPAVNRALASLWDRHLLVEESLLQPDHWVPRQTRRSFHHIPANGNYAVPSARSLCQIIRQHQLDPHLGEGLRQMSQTLRESGPGSRSRISSPTWRLGERPQFLLLASSIAILPAKKVPLRRTSKSLWPLGSIGYRFSPGWICFSSWSNACNIAGTSRNLITQSALLFLEPPAFNRMFDHRPLYCTPKAMWRTELVPARLGYDIGAPGKRRNR